MPEVTSDSHRPRKRSANGHSEWSGPRCDLNIQPHDDSSGAGFTGRCDDKRKGVQTRRRGRLDIFLSMPLDVVFEILGFLHPRDLVALTRTSRMIRQIIYPQGSIWRRSRMANEIPDCYPGVSEARWAFILFGGNHCHCCGVRNVHKVDFGLCRRVCAKCNRKNVVNATEFCNMFPQVDNLVLSLIPQTASLAKSWKNGFWKADIQRVAEEWRAHQQNIQLGTDNAEEEYGLYLEQRIKEVDRITQHGRVCIEWATSCAIKRTVELFKARGKGREAIREGLIALGFERRDIDFVIYLPIARVSLPLTAAGGCLVPEGTRLFTAKTLALARIQSRLVPLVEAKRDARIARESAYAQQTRIAQERECIQQIRASTFREFYSAYLFQLLPLDFWAPAHLPTVDDLLKTAPFKNIVESDLSVVVDSSSFVAAIDDLRLPQLIAGWQNSRTWIQSRPVPLVKTQQDAPIAPEDADIREIRTSIFREFYAAYLFQLLPLEFWAPAHLPTVDDLLELIPFKSIVESDPNVAVDSSSFTEAIDDLQLPQLIAEWQNSQCRPASDLLAI
ncbi:hypothetical protein BD779DRAFT_440732 [Infundibulicybe gibba]|nr:hypothetical protein BD779DRAFT_440732 [Infundibulicybe gibba]